MTNSINQRKQKTLIWLMVVLVFIAILFSVGFIYVNDYYHANVEQIATFKIEQDVTKEILEDNTIVYIPNNADTGFIFYPGGKVEYTAYEPLMKALADKGILCVLVEMPCNLAVLDINAADGIQEMYPDIQAWYIGGHSLGGSMAASYLAEHLDAYKGLILLGSYSTADLSQSKLSVCSIYGSEDKVLNHEKYTENHENLPDDYMEYIIDGGCHAYFGMYGKQEGDGTPTISNEKQIYETADRIKGFIIQ